MNIDHHIITLMHQYESVENVAKGEEIIKDNSDQTYGFVDKLIANNPHDKFNQSAC
jgi:hypothetical protein